MSLAAAAKLLLPGSEESAVLRQIAGIAAPFLKGDGAGASKAFALFQVIRGVEAPSAAHVKLANAYDKFVRSHPSPDSLWVGITAILESQGITEDKVLTTFKAIAAAAGLNIPETRDDVFDTLNDISDRIKSHPEAEDVHTIRAVVICPHCAKAHVI